MRKIILYKKIGGSVLRRRRHCSPICMINDRFSLKVNSIRITSATKANLNLGHVLFFPLYNGNFSNKMSLCFFPGKICTFFGEFAMLSFSVSVVAWSMLKKLIMTFESKSRHLFRTKGERRTFGKTHN